MREILDGALEHRGTDPLVDGGFSSGRTSQRLTPPSTECRWTNRPSWSSARDVDDERGLHPVARVTFANIAVSSGSEVARPSTWCHPSRWHTNRTTSKSAVGVPPTRDTVRHTITYTRCLVTDLFTDAGDADVHGAAADRGRRVDKLVGPRPGTVVPQPDHDLREQPFSVFPRGVGPSPRCREPLRRDSGEGPSPPPRGSTSPGRAPETEDVLTADSNTVRMRGSRGAPPDGVGERPVGADGDVCVVMKQVSDGDRRRRAIEHAIAVSSSESAERPPVRGRLRLPLRCTGRCLRVEDGQTCSNPVPPEPTRSCSPAREYSVR